MEGYCVRCKSKQNLTNPKEKTTANKRRMLTGKCAQCNCKMSVFLPNKSN